MTTRNKRIAFWGLTGMFAGLMLFSGALYLAGAPKIREAMAHLGYPAYLLTILGVAKLFGAVALLQDRAPKVREWAYAGFTIDLIGASASHLFSGDSILVSSVPAMFLLMLGASYALKPTPSVLMTRVEDRHPAIAA